ncbi:MAG: L-threonylcarbamoyladenylate synthase [Patescibacteria group bacterium]
MFLKLNDKEILLQTSRVLGNGGVVMHPTETCYGLAVDIFNKGAFEKLYEVKGRDEKKPVSILVSSLEMAQRYGEFNDKALELAKKYWPGALSIVVPRSSELPDFVNPGEEFVSIRWSSLEFCQKVVENLGRPITTTSANRSGQPQLYDVTDLAGLEGVDLVVDGGMIPEVKPSTIVKVDGDEVTVLRQGEIVV